MDSLSDVKRVTFTVSPKNDPPVFDLLNTSIAENNIFLKLVLSSFKSHLINFKDDVFEKIPDFFISKKECNICIHHHNNY